MGGLERRGGDDWGRGGGVRTVTRSSTEDELKVKRRGPRENDSLLLFGGWVAAAGRSSLLHCLAFTAASSYA